MPKVSIIVPIYNVENYLERCLESLINQTLKDIEIILVNDGSPDGSSEICEKYKCKDTRIKIVNKSNAGLGLARNSGLEVATGDYIGFVDADDYVSTEMFENLYNFSKKNDLDLCVCNFKRVYSNGFIENRIFFKEDKIFQREEIENILINMIGASPTDNDDIKIPMSVWRGIYSNKLMIEKNICFCSEREFISEDIIFDIDYYSECNKIGVLNEAYYYYCENNDSLSQSYKPDRFYKEKILYLEILRKIQENGLTTKAIMHLNRTLIGRSRVCICHEVKYNKNLRSALKNISNIINDELLQKVLEEYPIRYLPYKQKIFSYFTKWKISYILYILVKIRY